MCANAADFEMFLPPASEDDGEFAFVIQAIRKMGALNAWMRPLFRTPT
jgi:hypothetical protein